MPKTLNPDWSEELKDRPLEQRGIVVSSGISPRFWHLYAQAWLVCLLFPIVYLMQTPLAPLRLVIAVVALSIFVIVYTWFMWPHPLAGVIRARSGFPTSHFLFAGLVALTLASSLTYGAAFLWLFVGVSAVAGVALSIRNAFVMVMVLTLLALGLSVWMSGDLASTDWLYVIPLVLLVRGLGLDVVVLARLSDALRELHAAQNELARQAVIEERLRLARDLHDLLGHTLSMIALKSELAGRLIEQDTSQAAQEIHEIESAARQALREVREAVAGYRQPTLQTELEGARQILEAAGITCTIENDSEVLPPPVDAVLAWTVREGVTNVIRHSRARCCTIQVSRENGDACVEIVNDGHQEQGLDSTRGQTGTGLTGLAERVTTLGGQIEAGLLSTENNPHFRLWVQLPLRNSLAVEGKSQL